MPKDTLTFDAEHHLYRLNGGVIPSVTQVLSDAGVVDYTALPPHVRESALWRGTLVHQATQLFDEDDLDWDTLDPELAGYVRAYADFRKHTGLTPILREHRGHNACWGYAGTLDIVGKVPDGRIWLVDIKSGGMPKWTGLQTAAYLELDNIPADLHAAERYALQLGKNGTYRLSEPCLGMNDFGGLLGVKVTITIHAECTEISCGRSVDCLLMHR